MKKEKEEPIHFVMRGELAYFLLLHRLVSIISENVEDKDKRREISLMHDSIYAHFERPKKRPKS